MTYKHTYTYKYLNIIYNISILPECELPDSVTNPSTPSSASSTAKPPVIDKSSPLLISDDETEQEKGFNDSLMIVEDYEAPERNDNGADYGDEDVMIIDEILVIPDLPETGNEVLENVVIVQNKENKEPHLTKEYVVTEKPKESHEKNKEGMQNKTKGDQDKDKMSKQVS